MPVTRPQLCTQLWTSRLGGRAGTVTHQRSSGRDTRPDLALVPMPFLGYPGTVDALARRHPQLTDLLRGVLLEGELRQPDLQSLAARGPLLVEMDLRVSRSLYETVVPAFTRLSWPSPS